MEQILDDDLVEKEAVQYEFAGFWLRFFALLIDGIIIGSISTVVLYLNLGGWKNYWLQLIITLLVAAYKPFCEFSYGATIGKRAMKIKVVNENFEPLSLQNALLRDIFSLVQEAISIFYFSRVFFSASINDVDSFSSYTHVLSSMNFYVATRGLVGILIVVDAIYFLVNSQHRALHDLIGKTFVVQQH
jgi:uncharacterized RDD family membrane protein YckC